MSCYNVSRRFLAREMPTQVPQTKLEGNAMHWEQRIANYVREECRSQLRGQTPNAQATV